MYNIYITIEEQGSFIVPLHYSAPLTLSFSNLCLSLFALQCSATIEDPLTIEKGNNLSWNLYY